MLWSAMGRSAMGRSGILSSSFTKEERGEVGRGGSREGTVRSTYLRRAEALVPGALTEGEIETEGSAAPSAAPF